MKTPTPQHTNIYCTGTSTRQHSNPRPPLSTENTRHDSSHSPPSSHSHSHEQLKYGEFIHGLKEENITMNRKVLAELAANEPYSFKALVDQVKRMKGIPV